MDQALIDNATRIAMILLSSGLGVATVRLLRGPSLPDRVVALDLISMIVISMIGVSCIMTKNIKFLDPATILSLLAFVSTIAFARYIEKGA